MKLYYSVTKKHVNIFLPNSDRPIAKVRIGSDLSDLSKRLDVLLPTQDLSETEKAVKSIFNNKGNPRLVGLYGGYWTLKFDVPVRVRASRFDLESTLSYLVLRLCMHYNLPEDGVTANVIKHALRSMFYAKFGGRV